MISIAAPARAAGNEQAVFGSDRASVFLKDLRDGKDSLDIVTIGDSNAGFPDSGGWNLGLIKACVSYGLKPYATPLKIVMGNEQMTRVRGPWLGWQQTFSSPHENLRSGAECGPREIGAFCVPMTTLKPNGVTGVSWAFVPTGTSFQSTDWSNFTIDQQAASWCEPGAPLVYRVVYPTFPEGNGSIRPAVWNAASNALLAQAPVTSTNAGRYGLAAVETPFTMPASANVAASWNMDPAIGPAGAVYESIYRLRRGFSCTNIYYNGGSTVTTMAKDITGAGNSFWAYYFNEIIARQKTAGGSGRVLVWVNGGINGPSDYEQWTGGMGDIIDAITFGFVRLGGDIDKLAFICSVTHPTSSADLSWTEDRLKSVRVRAERWPDDLQDGVTYLNLEKIFAAHDALTNNWYSDNVTGQAHLSEAGYMAYASGIVSRLLEETVEPCPGDLDGSGVYDYGDIGLVLLDWGPCEGCPGDFDGSGIVDGGDVGFVLLNFGECR